MKVGIQPVFEAALHSHQIGDLSRAIAGYRKVIEQAPDFAPAHHYLGLLVYQQGDTEKAIALIHRALGLEPDLTEARYNLGNIFRELGRTAEAETCYGQTLQAEPQNADALLNLGTLLCERGAFAESESLLRRLIELAPGHPAAHAAFGALLLRTGRPQDALAEFRLAASRAPRETDILYNLGVAQATCGHARDAEATFRTVVRLAPGHDEAANNLGGALLAQRRHREAVPVFEGLVRRQPHHAGYLGNLAIALHGTGWLTAAEGAYRRALALEPGNATMHANLGTVLREQGWIENALAAYRQALTLDPQLSLARSNLLFALSFKEDADLSEVLAEHRRFDEIHARPLTRAARPHTNTRDPDRRLRVGYLSGDFRIHPCGFFLLPVIENHDHTEVESVCYSVGTGDDAFTRRFRSAASQWREMGALDDEALAGAIRADGIDILVECFGHMAGHRLLAVARKPAPVQVSFPMYPNTTGMQAVDYRLADPHIAPPSVDALYSEVLIRLPETHLCYEPRERSTLPASAMPFETNGYVTFGCFNNISKIGPRTVALWSRLLHSLPSARLVIKWLGLNDPGSGALPTAFAAHGIGPERLQLLGWADHPYEPFRDVDICLDPLRAAGGTTTCDALWMGVPVISAYDEKPHSRLGLSLLSNVGLSELVATGEDAYLQIACNLAANPQRLAALRKGLRERFMASPLMDGPRYTRFLEQAYRRIWQDWCRGGAA
ncbi:MAG: tetratricopeptide repeat protein [Alphaproteobacteria bacterium]|nr:tetratricopeptide repeat protein [Alphaproteobacteria bacterium]